MRQPLPVIIEDMIKVVTNPNVPEDDKQFYVSGLQNIRRACDDALLTYNSLKSREAPSRNNRRSGMTSR